MRGRFALASVATVAILLAIPLTAISAYAPFDPRSYNWSVQGVFAVGGGGLSESEVDYLYTEGFRAIADFRAEHIDPADRMAQRGITFLDLPIVHAVDINVTQLKTFVSWAQEQERNGRPIYAHCTNGWHRAAAFATAWEMERTGDSYDDVGSRVNARRDGSVMRVPGALLAYEAELKGGAALTVLLNAGQSRPATGGSMPANVEVLDAAGRPLAGATVHVWSENSPLDRTGTTDANGRFAFTYGAPSTSTDYLYARASKTGFRDGADNVEIFMSSGPAPTADRPVGLQTWRDGNAIEARVTKDNIAHRARVLVTTEQGTIASDWTATGRTRIPIPADAGNVTVRAQAWGSADASTVLSPGSGAPPPGSDTPNLVFDHRGGNEWWVEVFPSGPDSPRIIGVDASTPTSPWKSLAAREWGTWAGSPHVLPGEMVTFRARLNDGRTMVSCPFTHPAGVPECAPPPPPPPSPTPPPPSPTPPPPPPPSGANVTFTHRTGNEWWIEVLVGGADAASIAKVHSRDTGGDWRELTLRSWGPWAGSYHIEPGNLVYFRATLTNGSLVESCAFTHPAGVKECNATAPPPPPPPTPPPSGFSANFSKIRGNTWWVETDVKVTGGTLAGVDARVNGGAWTPLDLKSWGSWAKSMNAKSGTTVEFRARASDGSVATSTGVLWPPA